MHSQALLGSCPTQKVLQVGALVSLSAMESFCSGLGQRVVLFCYPISSSLIQTEGSARTCPSGVSLMYFLNESEPSGLNESKSFGLCSPLKFNTNVMSVSISEIQGAGAAFVSHRAHQM